MMTIVRCRCAIQGTFRGFCFSDAYPAMQSQCCLVGVVVTQLETTKKEMTQISIQTIHRGIG